jgi:hypothetical protein
MKLKDLNKIIYEGQYLLYDAETDSCIVYDNETRKKYEEYFVNELYPILTNGVAEVCIEIYKGV